MKQGVFWAGAAVQVILFQLILWFGLAGQRLAALSLSVAAVAVAIGMLLLYKRGVSRA